MGSEGEDRAARGRVYANSGNVSGLAAANRALGPPGWAFRQSAAPGRARGGCAADERCPGHSMLDARGLLAFRVLPWHSSGLVNCPVRNRAPDGVLERRFDIPSCALPAGIMVPGTARVPPPSALAYGL